MAQSLSVMSCKPLEGPSIAKSGWAGERCAQPLKHQEFANEVRCASSERFSRPLPECPVLLHDLFDNPERDGAAFHTHQQIGRERFDGEPPSVSATICTALTSLPSIVNSFVRTTLPSIVFSSPHRICEAENEVKPVPEVQPHVSPVGNLQLSRIVVSCGRFSCWNLELKVVPQQRRLSSRRVISDIGRPLIPST